VLVLGLAGLSYELEMKKAVVIFSGGIDSISACVYLKAKYDLYGISFLYGQKANQEIKKAKIFAKTLGLKDHKIVKIVNAASKQPQVINTNILFKILLILVLFIIRIC